MKSLRIATFNLLNFTAPPGASYQPQFVYKTKDWTRKCTWISNQLNRMQADIVAFQEVFSPRSLQSLAESAGYPYFATADTPRTKNSAHSGLVYDRPTVALASKFPIRTCKALHYYLGEELPVPSDFSFSRAPLDCVVDCDMSDAAGHSNSNNEGLRVVVVHLKSPRALLNSIDTEPYRQWALDWPDGTLQQQGYALSMWQRVAEAKLLHETLIADDKPAVLLGDFNDHLQSPAGRALQTGEVNFSEVNFFEDNIVEGGLNAMPSCITDSSEGSKPRYHNTGLINAAELVLEADKRDDRPTYYHQKKGLYLDHILFNPALAEQIEMQRYTVFDRHLRRNLNGALSKSDHAEVLAEWVVKN